MLVYTEINLMSCQSLHIVYPVKKLQIKKIGSLKRVRCIVRSTIICFFTYRSVYIQIQIKFEIIGTYIQILPQRAILPIPSFDQLVGMQHALLDRVSYLFHQVWMYQRHQLLGLERFPLYKIVVQPKMPRKQN